MSNGQTISKLLGILLSLVSLCSTAATFRVGDQCKYSRIQDAIDAADDNDIVFIRASLTPYAQKFRIENKTLTIVGQATDCSTFTTDPTQSTIISGQGQGPIFVLTTTDASSTANVTLKNLTLSGNASTTNGGGILVQGQGHHHLILQTTLVQSNSSAEDGGGIAAFDDSVVEIQEGSVISGNFAATKGGGIFASGGDVRVYMTDPLTSIAFNTASTSGGGIAAVAGAMVDIASIGIPSEAAPLAAIHGNRAPLGGGIHADGGFVRLYSMQKDAPTSVDQNGSIPGAITLKGGGVAVTGAGGLCGWGYSISNNSANQGAAIWSSGGGVQLFRESTLHTCNFRLQSELSPPDFPREFVDCTDGKVCNRIDGNTTPPDAVQSVPSGIVRVGIGGFLDAERFEMRGNTGTSPLALESPSIVQSCLLTGNVANTGFAVWVNQTNLQMDSCTASDNPSATEIIHVFGALTVSNSILWQPGSNAVGTVVGSTTIGANVIASGTVLGVSNVKTIDPQFLKPQAGDYHLKFNSPAIGDAQVGPAVDLEGHPRQFGAAFDIGAYARDQIFANGFQP